MRKYEGTCIYRNYMYIHISVISVRSRDSIKTLQKCQYMYNNIITQSVFFSFLLTWIDGLERLVF